VLDWRGKDDTMTRLAIIGAMLALAACSVQPPPTEYIPSKKSAAELRSVQSRVVQENQDDVIRAVIGTLHDLGYRITKVESGAGTVSATRQTALRMAVVTRPRGANDSIVRANATIVALYREAQVDSAEFYRSNFFEPLEAAMQRRLADVPGDASVPDAVRPTAERNTAAERRTGAPQPPSNERKTP
jgi:hypothetical protein